MSVEALAVVLHHSRASGTDKLVLIGIANHDGDGGAWPTVATLARYANVSERNVQKAVARLVQKGELLVERQAGGTSNIHPFERPNLYRITVACPVECDRTTRHRARVIHSPAPLPGMPESERVSESTPPVADDTRRVSQTTPKPSYNHPRATGSPTSTGPRASRGEQTCTVCSRTESACRRLHGVGGDAHDFTPQQRRAAAPAAACSCGGRLVLDESAGTHVCNRCGTLPESEAS